MQQLPSISLHVFKVTSWRLAARKSNIVPPFKPGVWVHQFACISAVAGVASDSTAVKS